MLNHSTISKALERLQHIETVDNNLCRISIFINSALCHTQWHTNLTLLVQFLKHRNLKHNRPI